MSDVIIVLACGYLFASYLFIAPLAAEAYMETDQDWMKAHWIRSRIYWLIVILIVCFWPPIVIIRLWTRRNG